MNNSINKVCVFCASSTQIDNSYNVSARNLGIILAENKVTVIYGGGKVGLMGELADGALSRDGKVIGIIPEFMKDLEWGHPETSNMEVVATMHERKALMRKNTDAAIALPGGSGTLEELLEIITLKRLGIYLKPIILVNTRHYFSYFLDLYDHMVNEKFMNTRHRDIFKVVEKSEDVIEAILNSPTWDADARHFAIV